MLKVVFGVAALMTAAGCGGSASSVESGGGAAQGPDISTGGTESSGSSGATNSGGGTGGAGSGAAAGAAGQSEVATAGAAAVTAACGGPTGVSCPPGQFCDLASDCGAIPNATGVCAETGKAASCDDAEGPEGPLCGCEGRTYANTCQRQELGMLQASLGICPSNERVSYPTAYGVWQATGGTAGAGPAVVVSAAGFAHTWDAIPAFSAETPPPNPTGTQALSREDTDDLFLRLAGVPTATLPHEAGGGSDCHASFYFRLCEGCAVRTVSYDGAERVLPEMELIWSWFDRILGPGAATNPRRFCN